MKAILEFNLDDVEDAENHRVALAGTNYWLIISEMLNQFRKVIKYSGDEKQVTVAEEWRKVLLDLIEDRAPGEEF